jgi:hypothetical protein
MAVVVPGGLLTTVVLSMLAVPALFLRYGVGRPGTAGAAAPRREPVPEGVGCGETSGGRRSGVRRRYGRFSAHRLLRRHYV